MLAPAFGRRQVFAYQIATIIDYAVTPPSLMRSAMSTGYRQK
jgi:hypothetical protein